MRFQRALFSLCLAVWAACLAGCDTFERGRGLSPILQAADVQSATANSTLILRALAADAGLNPDGPIDWYLVSEAGFNYVDDRCHAYFDDLFFLNRGREQTKSGLAAAGQTTAAILGVTGGTSETLTIVAQAFGLASAATDIVTGTFLYQLPPATTQGFVNKLQLAFRDAAASQRHEINSPTIAYHLIQRYLDLCLPPRIEAEITRQISSTTAIPVPQGPGALFTIETASTPPAAALVSMPLLQRRLGVQVEPRADAPLPARHAPDERRKIVDDAAALFVRQVRRTLCQPGGTTVDDRTRQAVRDYMKARFARVPGDADPLAPANRTKLLEASAAVPDCASAGLENAYEVGRFGVPADRAGERISRLQDKLASLLQSLASTVRVQTTGRFDAQTRAAIAEVRRRTGSTGEAVDADMDFKLLQD